MQNISSEIIHAIRNAANQAAREIIKEMGIEHTLDKLNSFPAEIRRQQDALVNARRNLEDARSNLELAKQVVVAGVIEEKNGDGKPKYSNEKAREAEITKRLATDPGYQAALQAYRAAEDAVNTAQFELDRLYNEFSACKAASRVLAGKLNLLANL
ncbi:MAG: hypothetical protein ACPLRU_00215 [Desulfofundulus sp.]